MEEIRRLADRFDLIEPVGGGSMGTVWRARDDNLERTVAIKELLLPHGQGEQKADEAKNRALREARIAARLVHPHAITVFGVIDEQDRPWIIMEYLPSTSLADKLRDGPMEVDDVIRLAIQLCSALAAAHRAGIVHRDIKPGNVLLGEDGTVKITDFGISRAMGDVQLTATGEISGTPAFLAPEVARGEDATSASDVFSLGATLYTALEGGTPYGTAENPIALLYRASSGEITPPVRSGILTPLLTRLLDVRPDSRPTMAETERELRALAAGEPTTLVAEEPPPRARKGALIGVIAGFLVLAAVAAVVVVLANRGDNPSAGAPPASSAAPTPTPTPSSSAEPQPQQPPSSAPSSSTPPPSTSSSAPPPPAQTPGQALAAYYALIPGNLQAGFATLTDNFKRAKNQSFERYSNFWKDYRGVTVSNVSESGTTVTATLTYLKASGGTTTERATFVMVQQDGRYLIDSQR
ncbi:serine/threonine-protein kinase [Amycolatopsis regifaucium]|uniref:non-specific serine/threonine protein kinase n=1 Tax=Amycolatopsis regifaucium TaxID=546365 RepID=A0A154M4P8_9PSEU|nr:serine/threonine-protein kinase [Amycolatopsis regifaucium]KZB79390.1 serine/threonine protein kinase [Amycolatopsis regifaucium]OKA07572.1 serine/threonine protein kinase [Amycolatopsis regifaucium]SFH08034.1 Serine/threonine protein kinase [Amycolatopsis regifaucium]